MKKVGQILANLLVKKRTAFWAFQPFDLQEEKNRLESKDYPAS